MIELVWHSSLTKHLTLHSHIVLRNAKLLLLHHISSHELVVHLPWIVVKYIGVVSESLSHRLTSLTKHILLVHIHATHRHLASSSHASIEVSEGTIVHHLLLLVRKLHPHTLAHLIEILILPLPSGLVHVIKALIIRHLLLEILILESISGSTHLHTSKLILTHWLALEVLLLRETLIHWHWSLRIEALPNALAQVLPLVVTPIVLIVMISIF